MNLVTQSKWRLKARSIIRQVIDEHCCKDVALLHQDDVRQLRRHLRAAYCRYASERKGWAYKIWREELGAVLHGNNVRARRIWKMDENDVMPGMRDWARQQGIIPA